MPARPTAPGWVTVAFLLGLLACTAARPPSLGLMDGRLMPCASRNGCISTQEEDAEVDPLRYDGSRDEGRRKLVEALRTMPGARVVTVAPHYVRAELTSSLGFVDDVEAALPYASGVIHLRSASRFGYDFGSSRRRLDEIRRRFEAAS